ncbi:anaerobic C4-dicarboxylate transporter family protein [Salmonella enterica]|uniref:anaerobic C4-dicarboxylate transporter family protein n=1 Tax=Salmonella enterica TaxID=28901 RepID=UPI00092FA22E|nr:anaerobic C4-dicarboxylate transporter family protein [Salmonella enterica]
MIVVELIIVLLAIFLGARLGGIGIGFAGGLGVLVLAAIGVKPGTIPFDVISIIMAVIAAISAMQVAGGLDYLVNQTEKLLRKNPKYITILAPIVTYFLTIFAGTGNISLATLPVIAEVAKEQGIKPCRPLSTAVVSAQIAITASPISAAVVYMSSVMEGHGISYIHLLSVVIPSTLLAVLVMSFLVTMLFNSKLSDDPIYRKRLEEGLIELRGEKQIEIKPMAKNSVWLFLLGVAFFGWAFITSLQARRAWMRIVQIILLAAALISVRPLQDWAFGSPSAQAPAHLNFTAISTVDELNQALAQAKGKPVMLDFYADWCVACKEFEKYTFSDPRVQQALGDTVLLQANVTANNAQDVALLKHLQVLGLPTILFFNAQGQEQPQSRVTGFMDAATFSAHLHDRQP